MDFASFNQAILLDAVYDHILFSFLGCSTFLWCTHHRQHPLRFVVGLISILAFSGWYWHFWFLMCLGAVHLEFVMNLWLLLRGLCKRVSGNLSGGDFLLKCYDRDLHLRLSIRDFLCRLDARDYWSRLQEKVRLVKYGLISVSVNKSGSPNFV